MTIEQFGATIKTKYPQYSQYSDVDIGQRMLQKYPQYQSRITTDTPSPALQNEINIQQEMHTPTSNKVLSAGNSAANFLGVQKLGQGIATAGRTFAGHGNDEGNAQGAAAEAWTKILKLYAPGSPERKAAMAKFNQVYAGGIPTEAEIDPGTTLSNKEVLGSAANTALLATGGGIGAPKSAIGKIGAGLASGYAFDVANNLEQNKSGKAIFKPGAGTVVGGSIPIVGTAVSKALPEVSKYLEKANLRLTPTQKSKLGKELDTVANYLSEKKIIGTPEGRFEAVDQLYHNTENKFQDFLSKDAKDIAVNKGRVVKELETLKGRYQNERDVVAIERQIDELKNTIEAKYPDEIPLTRLNQLKRSTFQNAYNDAGNKVLDSVEHDMGSVLKNNIESATKGMTIDGKAIADFNKEYGTLIKARGLLKVATGRNQLGLASRVLATLLGSAVSEHLGGGAITDVLAGGATQHLANELATPVRSAVSAAAKTTSQITSRIPGKKLLKTAALRAVEKAR